MMEFFDKWHPFLRWIAILPAFLITYALAVLVQTFSLNYAFGGYDEGSFFNFMIYRAYLDVFATGSSIYVAARCAPKGRLIMATLFATILIFIAGFSIAITLLQGSELPLWKNIFSIFTLIAGTLGGVYFTYIDIQKYKTNDVKNSLYS